MEKHFLLRKKDSFKTCQKSKFLGKKIWRNTLALKSKKVPGNVYLGNIVFSCFSSTKPDFFYFCYSGDKRLLSEFLRKWGWFQGHNEHFPNIVAKV